MTRTCESQREASCGQRSPAGCGVPGQSHHLWGGANFALELLAASPWNEHHAVSGKALGFFVGLQAIHATHSVQRSDKDKVKIGDGDRDAVLWDDLQVRYGGRDSFALQTSVHEVLIKRGSLGIGSGVICVRGEVTFLAERLFPQRKNTRRGVVFGPNH